MKKTARFQHLARSVIVGAFVLTSCAGSAWADGSKTSFFSNFQNTRLIDQNSNSFDFDAHQGKLMLVNFIYTHCPTVCSMQTFQLGQIRDSLSPALRDNVIFVSLSLDPSHDTPRVLKEFARQRNVDSSGWYFLTSNQNAIDIIVDRLMLAGGPEQAAGAQMPLDHSTALWLVDPQGKLMMRYSGVPVDVERVAAELEQLSELPN